MTSEISVRIVRDAEASDQPLEFGADLIDRALRWMGENPSAIVALFGTLVTILLFCLVARRNCLDATFKTLEMLQVKDAREARFALRALVSPSARHKGDFSKMKPEDRATASSIVLLFGFIGALARRRRIELGIFFDSFASSVVINHERLRAYSEWRDSYRPYQDGTLWKDFDWLAAKAKRYLAIQSDPLFIRRVAARLGIIQPPQDRIAKLVASAHEPLPPSTKTVRSALRKTEAAQ